MRRRILIYRDYGCADVSDLYAALGEFYAGRGIKCINNRRFGCSGNAKNQAL